MLLRSSIFRLTGLWSSLLLAGVFLSGCHGSSDGDLDTEATTASSANDEIQLGDDFWVELAQDFEEFVPEPGIGALVPPDQLVNKGRWGELIDWPEIAVGAANMIDGRIVTWASEVDDFFGDPAEVTTASIFDPLTGTFEDAGYSGHNMFCAGISMLPDGRIFLAGGGVHVSTVSVFEDNRFREIDSMAMARWYPTSTTLASGQVLTSLGTTASGYSELWTDEYGWQLLDNVNLQSALDFPEFYSDWYPALNVAPDGSLFHPGPNNELFSINLDQDDAYTAHGEREVGGKDRLYNTTVIYDVGKMLVAGGGQLDAKNTAVTIDLNGASPVVESVAAMTHSRTMQNSVVLPNGEVLVIGGNSSGKQFSDEGSILTPEIWNPETQQWREVATHKEPRNYHSTALLMQDARVISMGGGLCGACRTNHQNGEIYDPPYLFDADGAPAARPAINNAPAIAQAGDALTLTGSDDIVKFNMVRLVAVTHHHATDQRLVPVNFNKVGPGNYELQLNDNVNVLIPGYYWIFGLNQDGVPSTGHQIQVEVTTDVVETPAATDTNINYAYYEGFWQQLPDFDSMTPVATGTQSDFSLNNRQRNGAYGFVFTGTINVPADDDYTFYLSSDDGSRLSIDGKVVVNHDGPHRFEAERAGTTFLTAGAHAIKLEYYENAAGDGLLLSWSGAGLNKRPVTRFDLGSEVIDIPPLVVTPTPVTPTPVTPTPVNPVPVTPIPPAPVPGAGGDDLKVSYSYYEGNWNKLPVFDLLQPVKTGTLDNFSLAPRERNDFYAFRFDSRITVDTAGAYKFYTSSDDGSRLYVNGQLVVDNDGTHPNIERDGIITLASGEHNVRVEFFEKNGGDTLSVSWSGPGLQKQLLPDSAFVERAVVVTPVDQMRFELFDGAFTSLTELDGLVPDAVGSVESFDLSVASGVPVYGVRYLGRVQVDVADNYTFALASDDGARLLIDGVEVIDNDGQHPLRQRTGTVALTAGLHDIVVEYFESGGRSGLVVQWAAGGQALTDIPVSVLYSPDATVAEVTGPAIPAGAPSGYTVAPVWDYDLYTGFWMSLPDFDTLTPQVTSVTTVLDLSVASLTSKYAISFKGTIEVAEAGSYTFYASSDDGTQIFVDNLLVVDNDGLHPLTEKQGQVTLGAGVHDIEINYLQGFGGQGLLASWSGPGFAKTELVPGDSTMATATGAGTQLLPQLEYNYYEGAWPVLPDFDALQPVETGIINNFLLSVGSGVNQYGVQYSGQISVDVAGDYTFYVRSNDGSRLYVAGQQVVDNDGQHGAIERQGEITLQPGIHTISLDYFQNGGSEALQVFWSGPGFGKQLVPDSVLYQP